MASGECAIAARETKPAAGTFEAQAADGPIEELTIKSPHDAAAVPAALRSHSSHQASQLALIGVMNAPRLNRPLT